MTTASADEDEDAAFIDRLYGDAAAADLEEMRGVRALIARVREEAPEPEPPQAVSARLLLAAAEHAPKPEVVAVAAARPSLWARISGWLSPVTAHPGLAAAATLIVVVGAVVIWKRDGGEVAERKYAESSKQRAGAEKQEARKEEVAMAPGGDVAIEREQSGAAQPDPAAVAPPEEPEVENKATRPNATAPKRDVATRPAPRKVAPTSTPKEDVADGLVEGRGPDDDADDESGAGNEVVTAEPPPPPPAGEDERRTKDVAKTEPTTDKKPERVETDAERLTRQARTAAKRGDCKQVESLGVRVSELDPGYYERVFQKDPDIKACRAAH